MAKTGEDMRSQLRTGYRFSEQPTNYNDGSPILELNQRISIFTPNRFTDVLQHGSA